MNFHNFSLHLSRIETVSSRLEMTQLLASLYVLLEKDEIAPASYLMQGSLVPSYKTLEFQLSVKMVLRALAQIQERNENNLAQTNLFGESSPKTSIDEMTKEYKKVGDIGILAERICSANTGDSLAILETYDVLIKIAQESGPGSQDRKIALLVDLLSKSSATSVRFLVRIVVGKMRLGFSTMTIIDALSWSITGGKEDSKILEAAYQKKADVGTLATTYLTSVSKSSTVDERVQSLAGYKVEVGIPVVPALCQRLNTSQEIIEKLGTVIAEPKYDGLRIQIHVKNENGVCKASAFTRSLEDVSHMFPELKKVPKLIGNVSCILDAEAIGYDKNTGALLAFQATITRKRKHDVLEISQSIPIRFYVFDVLFLKGNELIGEKLQSRKGVLEGLFKDSDVLMIAPYIVTTDAEELHKFHETALNDGLEGAVMKKLDSSYVSGRKGWNWVKIKESEGTQGKLNDTLDVVLMGYYFGRGKRAQFGLGALLVGVIDSKQHVKTIAKIGTGMSEEQLSQLKKLADAQQSEERPDNYDVPKSLSADVWVLPSIVVEVAADELTQSPTHTAKVALRFPRLVSIRSDKTWEQATTVTELTQISHLKIKKDLEIQS